MSFASRSSVGGISFSCPLGSSEASGPPLDLEHGSDENKNNDKDEENTLYTRSTTTTESLQDIRTPSVLLPGFLAVDHWDREQKERLFFERGHGVVHVSVRWGQHLGSKPVELAMFDDELWNDFSANNRALHKVDVFQRFFESLCFGCGFSVHIYLAFGLIVGRFALICMTAIYLIWLILPLIKKPSQERMIEHFKARFHANHHNLDCYSIIRRERRCCRNEDVHVKYLCFVIYPVSLDAQAFVKHEGNILLGEGFGTVYKSITDFPVGKPDNLTILDDDLWNDFASKIIPKKSCYEIVMKSCFLILFKGTLAMPVLALIALAVYSVYHDDIIWTVLFLYVFIPATFALLALITLLGFFVQCMTGAYVLPFMNFQQRELGVKSICDDFNGQFQEYGYNIVFVEGHNLIAFTPMTSNVDVDTSRLFPHSTYEEF